MDRQAAEVFADPDTYSTCLLAVGLDRFEDKTHPERTSPLNWTTETWLDEIHDECDLVLSERNQARLFGGIVFLTQPNEFYNSAKGFNDVASAIAGEWFDSSVWHPPTVAECLWAVVETYLLDPPDQTDRPRFNSEVIGYVNRLAREEGYRTLPHTFIVFGLPRDDSLPPFEDYSSDPDLFAAMNLGDETRTHDLDDWLRNRMADFAERIKALPLDSKNLQAVVDELRQAVDR